MNEGKLEKAVRNSGSKFSLETVVTRGSKKLAEVTGLKPLAVVEAFPNEGGTWRMKIELIEREGIPNTMDLIGLYEVNIDAEGNLLNYSRIDMRKRGDGY